MRQVIVRYKLRPERLAEHEALLADVFVELHARPPDGLSYTVMKLADGVSFIHLARIAVAENPLIAVEAFKRFTAAIAERCEEQPATTNVTIMGDFASASAPGGRAA